METPAGSSTRTDTLIDKDSWMLDQLTRTITLRTNQDHVLWRIFSAFWAANAVLLVALFPQGRIPTDHFVTGVVTSVGFSFSLVWFFLQRRAQGHLRRHEVLMSKLEGLLRVPSDLAVSADVNETDYAKYLPSGPRARHIMPACSLLSAVLWAVAFVRWAIPCRP